MIVPVAKAGKRQGRADFACVLSAFGLLVRLGLGFMFTMSSVPKMGVLRAFVPASALRRHLDISCGCFSSSAAGKISYLTLIRAVVITLCSAMAYAGSILLHRREWQGIAPAPQTGEEMQADEPTMERGDCRVAGVNSAGRMPAIHTGGTPSPR